jgi:hypothetical protein
MTVPPSSRLRSLIATCRPALSPPVAIAAPYAALSGTLAKVTEITAANENY